MRTLALERTGAASPWKHYAGLLLKTIFLLAIIGGAGFYLYHQLHHYPLSDLLSSLTALSSRQVLIAATLVVLAYFILTFYDVVAFRYLHRKMPYPKVALATFLTYAFSQNFGFALIIGSSIRYRIYIASGLTFSTVTKIIALSWVTFTLGLLSITTLSLLIGVDSSIITTHIRPFYLHLVGLMGALILIGYTLANLWITHPFKIGKWILPLPGLKITLQQLLLATADFAVGGGILYALLPLDIPLSYFQFILFFALTIVVVISSHIPGGIGIFEALMLAFLSPYSTPLAITGALIAYRIFFYLIPLLAACLLFLCHHFKNSPRTPNT